jgi:hypothetical protein
LTILSLTAEGEIVQQDKNTPPGHGEGEGHLLLNIGKVIFLVAALAAAWFVLEWLIGRK